MDLPDTLLSGDLDQGNHATAKTLDRPTELGALLRQELWKYIDRTLINYQIAWWVRAPSGPVAGTATRQPGTGRWIIKPTPDTTIDITFPPILEADTKEMLEAITMAYGTELIPDEVAMRLMLEALGLNDIDEIMEQLDEMLAAQAKRRQVAAQAAVDAVRRGEDPTRAIDDPADSTDPDGSAS